MPEFTEPGGPLRQSLLRAYAQCPLSAKWQARGQASNVAMDQGTIGHRVAEEIVRTLQRQGESQIPTEEAMVIFREVYADLGIPLPSRQLEDLRLAILRFCEIRWPVRNNKSMIWDVEERLFAQVPCPDGVTRILTGKPDAVVGDPPDGAVVPDFKFGMRRPPKPREGEPEEQHDATKYLSPEGLLQLHVYAYLIWFNFPSVYRVHLREEHVRWGEHRRATVTRDKMEHVEYEIGSLLQMLDTSLRADDAWQARPGSHCSYCPRPLDCPIPPQERGEGAVHDEATMRAYAEAYVPTKAMKDHLEKAIKNGLAEGIPPARVGDRELGWSSEDKGRRFGLVKP
jgi:hypothetical protein